MSALRALAFALYFLILTVVMGIGAIPIRILRKRQAALVYAKLWARLVLAGLCRICAIRIDVTGRDNIPDGPCFIACQHQSYFDGFIWMNLVPDPAYIIKQELIRVPLVGPMLMLSGMIPVERNAGSKALRDLMRNTQSAFDDRRQIVIFPEGTRALPGERKPLQPGIVALAKQSPVPIVPVATDSGHCWPRTGFMKYPGTIHVRIGRPLGDSKGRAALIAAINDAWDRLSITEDKFGSTVDNSVGGTLPD
ncbi:1-acyl-sn-glycerol-3-phosphate acyltransferase [Neoasaia chiangmaiensis NBRC 101099]|uniref:Acyl-phosphate glycerol 3-phosphate acyltransferase n=1 Tax=Neoasaia chiangmaiensis TaxID=320497 RepID=A0A1U9KN28_9PROT|nr:lysophospholipid acyltransferase family protein [Neoasaia chiangmaiensis]AQS87193.1 acyl-phosphate glycerol 3-phosphate acyltransferase [Neoasaia chiangmaiensis]GBR38303.1 1-acyl-sn-glycerol-3-phosphate acyltransferase [Neoasaia chiangmaiensis NBRC 101099]GEN15958.1 1-acyl-sn-glycerol-3-phosphate acyltransferase [Neoasaia chiangmaiensis]